MDLSKINTSVLRSLIKLTEKRDSLVAELEKVDAAIASVYASGNAAPAAPAKAKKPAKAAKVKAPAAPKAPKIAKTASKADKLGKRGALKDSIIAALRAAGDKGVSVKELSDKLGVKSQNIHVWFSSTGKSIAAIQKVGPGRYRLKA